MFSDRDGAHSAARRGMVSASDSTQSVRTPRVPAAAARVLVRALDALLEEGIQDYALDTEFECRRVYELAHGFSAAERFVPPLVARVRAHPKARPPLSTPEIYALVHLARHLCYWGTAAGAEGGPALEDVRTALAGAEAVLPIAPMLPHTVPTAAALPLGPAARTPRPDRRRALP
jgi:hypothetical protein